MFLSEQKKKGATSGWTANKHFPHFSAQGCEGQKSSVMYNSPTACSAFSFFFVLHTRLSLPRAEINIGGKNDGSIALTRASVNLSDTGFLFASNVFPLLQKSSVHHSLIASIHTTSDNKCLYQEQFGDCMITFFFVLLITISLKVRN